MKQGRSNYPFTDTIKKTTLTLVAVVAVLTLGAVSSAMAQGYINFSMRVTGTVIAHVYGVGDAAQLTGNTAAETPAGTQAYAGALLVGSGFYAQLYGGPLGTLEDALVALGTPSEFRTGPSLGGTPQPQLVVVSSVPPYGDGVFQVRAWDNAGETIATWDAAPIRGKSDLFTVSNLGDGVLSLPADLANVRSFNIRAVALPVLPTTWGTVKSLYR